MKRILLSTAVMITILIGTSCDEQNRAAESTTTTTTEGTSTTGGSSNTTRPADTPRKTTISVGQGGTSVSTKKGTDVSVDNKGIKVGSKDVKVDIKTGD